MLASLISIALMGAIMLELVAPVWGVNSTIVPIQLVQQTDSSKENSIENRTQSSSPHSEISATAIDIANANEVVLQAAQHSAPQPSPQPAPQPALQPSPAYLPASKLTERPLVLQDIDPLLTSEEDDSQKQIVLRLLINEYGDVDQVLVEDAALPTALLHELQRRFLLARFLPGRLLDRAVPSAMRIAVSLQVMRTTFSGDEYEYAYRKR